MRKFYQSFVAIGESLQSPFLLAIRLFWGYQFLISGWGKLQNIDKVAGFFANLGIPFSDINVYLAAYSEFLGGLLILIGLFTRISAIPLIITMIVASLTAHWDSASQLFSDPNLFLREGVFSYLIVSLIIFIFGPGRFSLDRLFSFERGR